MNTDQKNTQPHSLILTLVNKAAAINGYSKKDHLTKREALTESIKKNIAKELEELNITLQFTEYLVEANHPNPAAWILAVFPELPNQTPGEWKKQIHQFAKYWIVYLSTLSGIDTIKLRIMLADSTDPFVWLGNLEKHLVSFICDNRLFMTEEEAINFMNKPQRLSADTGAASILSRGEYSSHSTIDS